MNILTQYVALLLTHFVADFMFQTHWQASNKSKNNLALLQHVTTYMIGLAFGSALIFGIGPAWCYFVLGNALLHFATDYVTSRFTARFFARKDLHNGFVVIGLDQWIHQATLAATMWIAFYA